MKKEKKKKKWLAAMTGLIECPREAQICEQIGEFVSFFCEKTRKFSIGVAILRNCHFKDFLYRSPLFFPPYPGT
jgi:hypothetical protein